MKQTLRLAEYFSPFLQVNLLHDFFEGNKCKGVTIEPSRQTAKLLSNLGMIFKPLPDGGFMILFNRNKESYFSMDNVLPNKLTFLLRRQDRYFINMSNLPFSGQGSVFYFSNLNCSSPKDSDYSFLHKESEYSGEELVVISATRTSVILKEPAPFTDLSFSSASQGTINPRNLQPGLEKLPQHGHPIDLSDYDDGTIIVNQKGKKQPVQALFLLHGNVPSDTIGIMELYLDNTPGAKYSLMQKGKHTFRKYAVQFRTRSTYWKYIIVQRRPENKLSGYKISNKQQTIGFSKPEMITLQNGREVAVITSENPLPLRQFPDDKYELSVQKNGKQTMMQISLPVPKVDSIKPDKDSRRMFSNMYVYV